MKQIIKLTSFLIITTIFLLSCGQQKDSHLRISNKTISNVVDGIKYEAGIWPHPEYSKPFQSLGNHRFIIKSPKNAEAVLVNIPWRRADENTAQKDIIIINAKSEKRIEEVLIQKINNESGTVIFKPQNTSDTYYIYYLPHESTGGYYQKVKYLSPSKTKKSPWI